jgi:hypothetical protein
VPGWTCVPTFGDWPWADLGKKAGSARATAVAQIALAARRACTGDIVRVRRRNVCGEGMVEDASDRHGAPFSVGGVDLIPRMS